MPTHFPDRMDTDRLVIRRPVLSDAIAIFEAYAQDLQVCHYMTWTPHTEASTTLRFIESCIAAWQGNDYLPYVIAESGSNNVLGMIDARFHGTTASIGYVLAKAHWGKGLMREAIIALTQVIFKCPDYFRVQASCDVDNVASQRVLEKSGFCREGCLQQYTVHPNISRQPRACYLYASCR